MEGVFAAGDFRRGTTTFVVDAVRDGHRAAESIHQYLIGVPRSCSKLGKDYTLPNQMRERCKPEEAPTGQGNHSLSKCEDRIGSFAKWILLWEKKMFYWNQAAVWFVVHAVNVWPVLRSVNPVR